MKFFTVPRSIVSGWGALDHLKNLKGRRAFVVTDPGLAKLGYLERVLSLLKEAGMAVDFYSDVESDPTFEVAEKGAKKMSSFRPDLIVGVGGGSSLDAGKAMWVLYEHPDLTWEKALVPFGVPPLRQKAYYVAIPTTSGTASEVTLAAVLTNRKQKPNFKQAIVTFEITPDVAILDPELPSKMPPGLTADTGFDALVHATEAIVSKNHQLIADGLALHAIETIYNWLPKAHRDGTDREAREAVHVAASMAGMAHSNAELGLVHAMAHQLGAEFRIPHGRANAVMLPYVIEYNAKVAADRYHLIAARLGLSGKTPRDSVPRLVDALRGLLRTLNLPLTIKDVDVSEGDFAANLSGLAEHAMKDGVLPPNPRVPTAQEVESVYRCAYEGKRVQI